MKRLTDKATAAALKANVQKLQAVGAEVDITHLRYIRLAEYEDAEERRELINPSSNDVDGWYE